MKIRILTQNPFSVWFGWVEVQASKYIEYVKKNSEGIDIDFFSWAEESFDILHIIWIHTWINPYWLQVMKSKGIKIVISPVFYLKPNYFFDFRRPIIYKIFSFIPHHIVNWMKESLILADRVLPNSESEKKQIVEVFWTESWKISVLYNWVDWAYFEWINQNLFKETYNVWEYFLCVSHMEPRKNHLALIKAFIEYKKTWGKEKLVLLWKMRWNYFSYHQKLKEMLLDHKNDILVISDLDSSQEIFKSAYLWSKAHILLSSLETPWLSNLEAYLWNKPLILGDCYPVREYFGNDAVYVDPKNQAQIVKAFQSIENHSWINFPNKFTWDSISQELIKIYIELWTNHKK